MTPNEITRTEWVAHLKADEAMHDSIRDIDRRFGGIGKDGSPSLDVRMDRLETAMGSVKGSVRWAVTSVLGAFIVLMSSQVSGCLKPTGTQAPPSTSAPKGP